ncbi:MAG TPA: DUF748 domain-containing protein, partial [Planctomycetota bacterium]|nr:DUF748 domain-containing protein [Planctomycetota bacterium]
SSASDTPPPSLELTDAHLAWRDERRGPQAALALDLERLSFDPSAASAGPNVHVQLAVPGVVEAVSLVGRVEGSQPSAKLELKATGVRGTSLDPFLASSGWATDFQDGALTASVDVTSERDAAGALRGRASLHDVVLSDGDRPLAQLGGVTLEGLDLGPDTTGLHIGTLAIEGPVVGAERDAQGVLRVAGLRRVPVVPLVAAPVAEGAGSVAPPAETSAAPPASAGAAPLLALDNVRWRGAAIALADLSVDPPVKLQLRPELDGTGLRLGGDAPAGEAVLRVGAEDMWETCSLRLALRGGDAPGDLRATLGLDASDVQATALRGWLAAAGLSARGLHASLGAMLELTAGAAATDLRVTDLVWQDGAQPVLSVPEIRVRGLRDEGGGTRLDAIEVPGLDLRVTRAIDGAIDFGNLSILAAAPAAAAAPAVAPSGAAPAMEPPAPAASPPAPLALGALRFGTEGVRLHWHDKSVSPAAEVELSLRASLDGLVLGAPAPPARVQLQLAAPGVCESVEWTGTLSLAPDAQELDGALDVRGLRLDALAGYLPPGCGGALHDGRLALRARAQSGVGALGGRRASLQVSDVAFRDGEGEPLLALERLALDASRLDPAAGVAVVDDVAVRGLAVHAERRPGGALAVMGLELSPASVSPGPPSATDAATTPAVARAAGGLETLPLRDVRIEHVDVELRRLELTDASGAGGVPLVVAARLSNPEPLVLLDRRVDDLAPCKLELRASALPLARALDADLFLDASSSRPGFTLDLRAEGLRGAGLTEVLPELAASVDGSGLADGSFHAHLGAELSWPRRGPLDLDLSGGLSGDVELTDLAFRAQPEGEVLLGCERLDVALADVRPATGAARLSSVELTGLRGRLDIVPGGIAALGLIVRTPPEPPPAETPAAAPVPPPAPPGPEVKIDLFSVSGFDFVLRDETCMPPMVLPFSDLELEARGWSSWAHVAPRPLRFTGSVRGGLVALPWRERRGVLPAAGAQADAEGGLQQRPLFDELALQGRLTQFPETTGWVNASLSALELPALAGPAAGAGVTLDDGLLDLATHVRYARGEDPRMSATLTFTSLKLSESSGGPISSFLHLPAPLDTVVFLLRNNEGQISIPLDFDLPPEGFGGGRVLATAGGAMGSVIGRAVASSPLRLAGTVTDFVGVTDSGEPEPVEPPVVVEFEPGDPAPPPGARATAAQLAARLLDDDDLALVLEHHFSAGDAQRALELGNPSTGDATLVAERLRLERAELLRRRDEAAAEARALLAVGRQVEADAAAARLRDADRALGAREESLDRVLGLLDKGAERRAPQRARGAGVEFGEARLREVRALLEAAGGPELLERVELRPVRFVPDEEPGGGNVTLTLKARPHSGGLLDWMFGWIPKLFASSPKPPEEGS